LLKLKTETMEKKEQSKPSQSAMEEELNYLSEQIEEKEIRVEKLLNEIGRLEPAGKPNYRQQELNTLNSDVRMLKSIMDYITIKEIN